MNGFVSHQLEIGSNQPVHRYKLCNKCEEQRPPEGGIQMSQAKWHCASCWATRASRSLGGRKLEKAK